MKSVLRAGAPRVFSVALIFALMLGVQSVDAAITGTGKVTRIIVKNGTLQVELDTANDSNCTSKYRWDLIKGPGAGQVDESDWELIYAGLLSAYYAGQTVQLRSQSDVCNSNGYAAGAEWAYVVR